MAIFDKESTMDVKVGGGKKEVPFRYKFYQTFTDILEETNNNTTKQQNHVDFVNEANEAAAKIAARNKYLQGDGAKFKAIDDQVKAWTTEFEKQKKRSPSELEVAKKREHFTTLVLAAFEDLAED
jgi:SMC interacting uncharacterized protein involved in chromosome segregation